MEGSLRNVCISSAVVRVCCKKIGVDQAIQEALRRNRVETFSVAEYTKFRRDVDEVLAGRWPRRERQLELTI